MGVPLEHSYHHGDAPAAQQGQSQHWKEGRQQIQHDLGRDIF